MYRFFPQKRVASCSIITRDIRKDLVLLHRLGSRVVPELEIMIVIHPSSTTKLLHSASEYLCKEGFLN